MIIRTKAFGEIELEEDKVLKFEEGIPGFKEEKEFVIIYNDEDEEISFQWLQSVKTPDLTFVIVNPFEIYADYSLDLSESIRKKLEIEDVEDVAVYTIVVIPEDISKMTTNLIGPIVINQKNKRAKQIILENDNYSTRHYIIDQKAYKESQGGKTNADTI